MKTEVLTTKQKENRLYYAKNAEKIKAQKRESYKERKSAKQVGKTEKPNPSIKVSAKPVPKIAKTARSRIEDLKLAKDLGIEVLDL